VTIDPIAITDEKHPELRRSRRNNAADIVEMKMGKLATFDEERPLPGSALMSGRPHIAETPPGCPSTLRGETPQLADP
jgi:hypothetical protein